MAVWECGSSPQTRCARNEPNKNGFLTWKHLLSEPLAMGLSGSQVPALERSSKPQVLLCKCMLWNKTETLSEERGEKKKEHMYAIHLFRATQSANHPLHHSVPREKLLRNNLCYSRELGLCFCATWRKRETFFLSLWNSACINHLGEDHLKPLTLANSDQPQLTPSLTSSLSPLINKLK